MMRLPALALAIGCAVSCASGTERTLDLVFLTREGCVNTVTMRANLDSALKALNRSSGYALVDLDTLAKNDPRTGYPTPTILMADHDLFGLPKPAPPYPEPT